MNKWIGWLIYNLMLWLWPLADQQSGQPLAHQRTHKIAAQKKHDERVSKSVSFKQLNCIHIWSVYPKAFTWQIMIRWSWTVHVCWKWRSCWGCIDCTNWTIWRLWCSGTIWIGKMRKFIGIRELVTVFLRWKAKSEHHIISFPQLRVSLQSCRISACKYSTQIYASQWFCEKN